MFTFAIPTMLEFLGGIGFLYEQRLHMNRRLKGYRPATQHFGFWAQHGIPKVFVPHYLESGIIYAYSPA